MRVSEWETYFGTPSTSAPVRAPEHAPGPSDAFRASFYALEERVVALGVALEDVLAAAERLLASPVLRRVGAPVGRLTAERWVYCASCEFITPLDAPIEHADDCYVGALAAAVARARAEETR